MFLSYYKYNKNRRNNQLLNNDLHTSIKDFIFASNRIIPIVFKLKKAGKVVRHGQLLFILIDEGT